MQFEKSSVGVEFLRNGPTSTVDKANLSWFVIRTEVIMKIMVCQEKLCQTYLAKNSNEAVMALFKSASKFSSPRVVKPCF